MNTLTSKTNFKHASRLNGVTEYYFSKKLREIDLMNQSGEPVINLGIGNPDLKPPDQVCKALIDGLKDPNFHRYQSYKGLPELRAAFANWYQLHYGVCLNPDNEIMPLMGSKEGITHISMSLLDKGDRVLVPDPGYPTYAAAARLAEGIPVSYSLLEKNMFLPDWDELLKMDISTIKMMWVNYPHMPTGVFAHDEVFQKLLLFAQKHNILIVNDNPYSFILTEKLCSLLKFRKPDDLVLELNSLSKSHNMAGWRVGVIAGNAGLIQQILTFKSNMDSGMFKPIMMAAIEALAVDKDWYQELNLVYKERKMMGLELAQKLNCEVMPNQVGMFIWAKVPNGNGEQFADDLLREKRVFVPPGKIFGKQGIPYIRFSLCSSCAVFQEVLDRIKR